MNYNTVVVIPFLSMKIYANFSIKGECWEAVRFIDKE